MFVVYIVGGGMREERTMFTLKVCSVPETIPEDLISIALSIGLAFSLRELSGDPQHCSSLKCSAKSFSDIRCRDLRSGVGMVQFEILCSTGVGCGASYCNAKRRAFFAPLRDTQTRG